MYGLVEYALIREEMHRNQRNSKIPHEFDLPFTHPVPKLGKERLKKILGLFKRNRRKVLRYLSLHI